VFVVLDRVAHSFLRVLGARSVHAETGAGRVHCYDLACPGAGTFVLIHGLGTSATSFGAVVRRLRPRAGRILLVELPGHGRSEVPHAGLQSQTIAQAVRDALDGLLEPSSGAVVHGTSLGGAVALSYALDRPSRVGALVLASPAGAPMTVAELAQLRRRFDLQTRTDARRFFAELLHRPPLYLRAFEDGLIRQLGRPLVREFVLSLGAGDFFSGEQVARLEPPTTVLWGKSDRVVPRSGLEFYRSRMPPRTRFEEIDSVGHSPHIECPALLTRRLLEAFASGRGESCSPI
jgi:pimeloyl-ACP methyl ester carboxylesterase